MSLRRDLSRRRKLEQKYNLIWYMLDQAFWFILVYRILNKLAKTPVYPLARILEKFFEFIFKSYLPCTTEVGPGLVIFHAFGVVINGKCKIGENLTLYQNVCLGNRWPGDGAPVIGDNVTIGSGAVILGPCVVPSNGYIPANSLVTPDNLTKTFKSTIRT